MMLPELSYEEALMECNIKTIEGRRADTVCVLILISHCLIMVINCMINCCHTKLCEIRNRETRLSGEKSYNFYCRTQRFENKCNCLWNRTIQ